jgi:hypothetical protein
MPYLASLQIEILILIEPQRRTNLSETVSSIKHLKAVLSKTKKVPNQTIVTVPCERNLSVPFILFRLQQLYFLRNRWRKLIRNLSAN